MGMEHGILIKSIGEQDSEFGRDLAGVTPSMSCWRGIDVMQRPETRTRRKRRRVRGGGRRGKRWGNGGEGLEATQQLATTAVTSTAVTSLSVTESAVSFTSVVSWPGPVAFFPPVQLLSFSFGRRRRHRLEPYQSASVPCVGGGRRPWWRVEGLLMRGPVPLSAGDPACQPKQRAASSQCPSRSRGSLCAGRCYRDRLSHPTPAHAG
jgi:hypothetical protein